MSMMRYFAETKAERRRRFAGVVFSGAFSAVCLFFAAIMAWALGYISPGLGEAWAVGEHLFVLVAAGMLLLSTTIYAGLSLWLLSFAISYAKGEI